MDSDVLRRNDALAQISLLNGTNKPKPLFGDVDFSDVTHHGMLSLDSDALLIVFDAVFRASCPAIATRAGKQAYKRAAVSCLNLCIACRFFYLCFERSRLRREMLAALASNVMPCLPGKLPSFKWHIEQMVESEITSKMFLHAMENGLIIGAFEESQTGIDAINDTMSETEFQLELVVNSSVPTLAARLLDANDLVVEKVLSYSESGLFNNKNGSRVTPCRLSTKTGLLLLPHKHFAADDMSLTVACKILAEPPVRAEKNVWLRTEAPRVPLKNQWGSYLSASLLRKQPAPSLLAFLDSLTSSDESSMPMCLSVLHCASLDRITCPERDDFYRCVPTTFTRSGRFVVQKFEREAAIPRGCSWWMGVPARERFGVYDLRGLGRDVEFSFDKTVTHAMLAHVVEDRQRGRLLYIRLLQSRLKDDSASWDDSAGVSPSMAYERSGLWLRTIVLRSEPRQQEYFPFEMERMPELESDFELRPDIDPESCAQPPMHQSVTEHGCVFGIPHGRMRGASYGTDCCSMAFLIQFCFKNERERTVAPCVIDFDGHEHRVQNIKQDFRANDETMPGSVAALRWASLSLNATGDFLVLQRSISNSEHPGGAIDRYGHASYAFWRRDDDGRFQPWTQLDPLVHTLGHTCVPVVSHRTLSISPCGRYMIFVRQSHRTQHEPSQFCMELMDLGTDQPSSDRVANDIRTFSRTMTQSKHTTLTWNESGIWITMSGGILRVGLRKKQQR